MVDITQTLTLMQAAERYPIRYAALKAAAKRYMKTDGKFGLKAEKYGGREWRVVIADLEHYLSHKATHRLK